ncbi:MAG TPA: SRPBCC family protein [Bauldia sp.]|nr:SRPBCC family protein [Bauldia sp.]
MTSAPLQINPAPVRKSIHVRATPERAFRVFTAGMGRWWRPEHHIAPKPFADVVMEPRTGGRWYERDAEGSECEWGKVLAWDPPQRVVLAWQLNSEWKYDAGFITELEINFTPEDGGTRVVLEHRDLEKFGAKAAAVRASLDSIDGWNGALGFYARTVEAAV